MSNNIFTDYFGFNKQQRNGLAVLLSISLFLLIVRMVYPHFLEADPLVLKNLPLIKQKLDSQSVRQLHSAYKKPEAERRPFAFDPNIVSYEELLALGLREKTAKALVKFRSKGFVFKKAEDLKKIYGLSPELYASLEPFVVIRNKVEQKPAPQVPEKKAAQKAIELNSSDSISLSTLPGVGSAYARRIIKYREALGGFAAKEQLKEVYGLAPELYDKINSLVFVDVSMIRKLDLNKDEFKQINKHPYITYEMTKNIFNWRKKTTLNPTNLKEIINDDEAYSKLLPYLSFPQ